MNATLPPELQAKVEAALAKIARRHRAVARLRARKTGPLRPWTPPPTNGGEPMPAPERRAA